MTNLRTELTLRTEDGSEGRIKDLSPAVLQAVYHQLTGKREITKKKFEKDYVITKDSVKSIIERMTHTIEQFMTKGANVNITIMHDGKDRQTCSSLEKFLQYDEGRSDPISLIKIEFSFLIASPSAGEYQSYMVNIDMASYRLLKKDRYANFSQFRQDYGIGIYTEIQYIDYVISRTMLHTIEECISSLQERKIFKLPEFLLEHDYELSHFMGFLFAGTCLFTIQTLGLFAYLGQTNQLVVLGFLFVTTQYAAKFVLNKIFTFFSVIGKFCVICINEGDKNNMRIFEKRRSKYNTWGGILLTGVFIATIMNLFSPYVYDWLQN